MRQMDLDPSLAFTALLELDPLFGNDGAANTPERRRALLEAWWAQNTVTNFWSFSRQWLFEEKVAAAGRQLQHDKEAAGDDPGLKSDAWERYFEVSDFVGDAFRQAQAKHP